MLNLIAQVLFMACVVGQITVGTSPAIAVLLAAIGTALMLIRIRAMAS